MIGCALKQKQALVVFSIGVLLIGGVVLSIVIGAVHSIAEVLLGTAIGFTTLCLFGARYLEKDRASPRSALLTAFGSLVFIVMFQGYDLSTERLLHNFASAHATLLGCTEKYAASPSVYSHKHG
jgi:FtsH-binding integral membrane protein